MSLTLEKAEIERILFRFLDNLSLTVSSQAGRRGAQLRQQIGRIRADYMELLNNDGFPVALLACFKLIELANAKLASVAYVRQQLYEETPVGDVSISIVMLGIVYCLGTESRMISLMTFTSRDDVDVLTENMKIAFDTARDLAADNEDSSTYQALTFLAGAITNHLATTARPLPRMMSFNMPKNYPALKLSYRIYYEADRAEELVQENKTVHPAFMQRQLRGMNR